jgi:hypothetical protein
MLTPRLLCWTLAALATSALAAPPVASPAPASVREQEMATCQPGEQRTWPDGRDRRVTGPVQLAYRHGGAPSRFSAAQVRAAVQTAAQAWAACGVPVQLLPGEPEPGDVKTVVVQWNAYETRGNFALANLSQRTLSLSADMFALLARRNPRHPAAETLQMAISHEMGHFFGLMAHSRRCVDVMSYYDNGQGESCSTRDGGSHKAVPEYRALLPTACDIARCRAVNGLAP